MPQKGQLQLTKSGASLEEKLEQAISSTSNGSTKEVYLKIKDMKIIGYLEGKEDIRRVTEESEKDKMKRELKKKKLDSDLKKERNNSYIRTAMVTLPEMFRKFFKLDG